MVNKKPRNGLLKKNQIKVNLTKPNQAKTKTKNQNQNQTKPKTKTKPKPKPKYKNLVINEKEHRLLCSVFVIFLIFNICKRYKDVP